MPVELKVTDGILRITLTGAFSREDLDQLLPTLRAADDPMASALPRVTDLTEASGPQVTFADVLSIVRRLRRVTFPNSHRSALVAPGPMQYGFARMFHTLCDHPQITVGVFRDMPAALEWLTSENQEAAAAN